MACNKRVTAATALDCRERSSPEARSVSEGNWRNCSPRLRFGFPVRGQPALPNSIERKHLPVMKTRSALLLALAVLLAGGCTGTADKTPNVKQSSAASDGDSPQPADESAASEPDSGEMPAEISASHILVMHESSMRVPAGITRTKEEALARAQEVARKAQAEGADFAALAKEYSDGPSGPTGGDLGNFAPGDMVQPFSEATLRLAVGEVSDPIETPFGYHVIRRQQVREIPKASAKHILVMYQGSMRAPPEITRTKQEALERIGECLERLKQGESFEALAREYSDGPTGPRGGDLGEFPQGMMAPSFDEAVFSAEVGETTDIVETPFGYHVIYRYK